MIEYINAIRSLRPSSKFSILNGVINWLDTENPQPTEEQIAAEMTRLQTEFGAKEYQRQRVLEYPSIGDQLDALFHAGVFPSDMAEQIQAVKDKYPKV